MFDYDDTVNLAFDAKIAGKKLVTAKHELLTKTGDFLFLAHSDKELAQRMQMVEEDIEKVAYRKLANVSDSKAKLVRAIYDEWSIRHANCDFCKEAKNVSNDGGGRGKAPAMQSMMTAVPGAKDPGIVKDVTDTAKDVAHAVGTGVGAVARGELGVAKGVGSEITKLPGQVGDAVKSVGTGAKDVAHAVGTGIGANVKAELGAAKAIGTGIVDVAKGAISGAGSLISQFTQGFKGNSTPAKAPTMPGKNLAPGSMFAPAGQGLPNESNSHDADARIHTDVPGVAGTGSYTPSKPVGPSIGQGPAPTAPAAPGKNLVQQFPGSMLAPAGQAPKAPVTPPKPVGPSIFQGPASPAAAPAPSATVGEYSGQIPQIPHQGVDTSVAPSSDSDADGDVDMGRAASKIANLSELLKGSNDTNFIG